MLPTTKKHPLFKFLCTFVAALFSVSVLLPPRMSYAQIAPLLNLPAPGAMVTPSPAFVPPLLKGMTIHPENPLQFDFIIDSGNSGFDQEAIKAESERLVKYFLASMTVPQNELWVNLSPEESDRIIPDYLGKTTLGRDMLAQDYLLKQLSASLLDPETELGDKFWKRVRAKAEERFGTSQVPTNTFNKVWVLPEAAQVYEYQNTVYITHARLKVMTDADYVAAKADPRPQTPDSSEQQNLETEIIREIIIPEIEKEVNQGENFAPLRQIYHSLILAKWYKETIKDSLLSQVYVDQNKVAGVNVDDETVKEQIYERYIQAYQKGVFNYIREDYDRLAQDIIPRKYFSGGITGDVALSREYAMVNDESVGDRFVVQMEVAPQHEKLSGKAPADQSEPRDEAMVSVETEEFASVDEAKERLLEYGRQDILSIKFFRLAEFLLDLDDPDVTDFVRSEIIDRSLDSLEDYIRVVRAMSEQMEMPPGVDNDLRTLQLMLSDLNNNDDDFRYFLRDIERIEKYREQTFRNIQEFYIDLTEHQALPEEIFQEEIQQLFTDFFYSTENLRLSLLLAERSKKYRFSMIERVDVDALIKDGIARRKMEERGKTVSFERVPDDEIPEYKVLGRGTMPIILGEVFRNSDMYGQNLFRVQRVFDVKKGQLKIIIDNEGWLPPDPEFIFQWYRTIHGQFLKKMLKEEVGRGLGTPISRRWIHFHGGSIDMRSFEDEQGQDIVRTEITLPILKPITIASEQAQEDDAMLGRREFLKQAGKVATGAVLASCVGAGCDSSPTGIEKEPEQPRPQTTADYLDQLSGITDMNEARNHAAYKAILQMGTDAIPALKSYINDTSKNINSRRWAVVILSEVGDFLDTFNFLSEVIGDTDTHPLLEIAVNTLADLIREDISRVDILINRLSSGFPDPISLAYEILIALGQDVFDRIGHYITQSDNPLQNRVDALLFVHYRTTLEEFIVFVSPALDLPESDAFHYRVREILIGIINESDAHFETVLAMLDSEVLEEQTAAIKAMVLIGNLYDERREPIISKITEYIYRAPVRDFALPALGQLKAVEAVPALLDRLGRYGDYNLLSRLGPVWATVVEIGVDAQYVIIDYIFDTSRPTNGRKWAARILGVVGDLEVAFPQLIDVSGNISGIFEGWHQQEAREGLIRLLNRQDDRYAAFMSELKKLDNELLAHGLWYLRNRRFSFVPQSEIDALVAYLNDLVANYPHDDVKFQAQKALEWIEANTADPAMLGVGTSIIFDANPRATAAEFTDAQWLKRIDEAMTADVIAAGVLLGVTGIAYVINEIRHPSSLKRYMARLAKLDEFERTRDNDTPKVIRSGELTTIHPAYIEATERIESFKGTLKQMSPSVARKMIASRLDKEHHRLITRQRISDVMELAPDIIAGRIHDFEVALRQDPLRLEITPYRVNELQPGARARFIKQRAVQRLEEGKRKAHGTIRAEYPVDDLFGTRNVSLTETFKLDDIIFILSQNKVPEFHLANLRAIGQPVERGVSDGHFDIIGDIVLRASDNAMAFDAGGSDEAMVGLGETIIFDNDPRATAAEFTSPQRLKEIDEAMLGAFETAIIAAGIYLAGVLGYYWINKDFAKAMEEEPDLMNKLMGLVPEEKGFSKKRKALEFLPEAIKLREEGYDFKIVYYPEEGYERSKGEVPQPGDPRYGDPDWEPPTVWAVTKPARLEIIRGEKIVEERREDLIIGMIKEKIVPKHYGLITEENIREARRLFNRDGDFHARYYWDEADGEYVDATEPTSVPYGEFSSTQWVPGKAKIIIEPLDSAMMSGLGEMIIFDNNPRATAAEFTSPERLKEIDEAMLSEVEIVGIGIGAALAYMWIKEIARWTKGGGDREEIGIAEKSFKQSVLLLKVLESVGDDIGLVTLLQKKSVQWLNDESSLKRSIGLNVLRFLYKKNHISLKSIPRQKALQLLRSDSSKAVRLAAFDLLGAVLANTGQHSGVQESDFKPILKFRSKMLQPRRNQELHRYESSGVVSDIREIVSGGVDKDNAREVLEAVIMDIDSAMISKVGGIDMNEIDVKRQGEPVQIHFNQDNLQPLLDMPIEGFAPVIINVIPIQSVLPLLGLQPNREEELIAKVD